MGIVNHGHRLKGAKSPTYVSWEGMKQRCLNPKHKSFHRYGGLGVVICDKWLKFEGFLEDMGEKPVGDWAISRKGDAGNYEPGNCDWKTKSENNSESSRGERHRAAKLKESDIKPIFELRKQGLLQREIAERFGVRPCSISAVLNRKKWSHVDLS